MPDTINAALLIIRIGIGIVFLAHGIKHARGRAKTSNWFASIGFKSPDLQWLASTATEIGVGALLIVGLLTGFAAAGVIGIMFVAYWTVHRTAGFFITSFMKEGVEVEGYEYVAVLGMLGLALAVSGPGEFSLDHVIELSGVTLAEYLDGRVGAILAIGAIGVSALQLATFWRPDVTD
jgi:putative oxidoreductase